MYYAFPSLPAVQYLRWATDLKPWIWAAVAAAMTGLGWFFSMDTAGIICLLMILLLVALVDITIMKMINISQTQERFDWLMNFAKDSQEAVEAALVLVTNEEERIKLLQPLFELLTRPGCMTKERQALVQQLPPVTLECLTQYCQGKLKLHEAMITLPDATPGEIEFAEDKIFELGEFMELVTRKN